MNCTNPANLGVLACPGGEVFAKEVIAHIKRGYHRSFDRQVAKLAKRYNMEPNEVSKRINFNNDAVSPIPHLPGNIEKFRPPHFKVPVRFTYFPNGEIKAEILKSVRGKDLYIVQDVENHYPVR